MGNLQINQNRYNVCKEFCHNRCNGIFKTENNKFYVPIQSKILKYISKQINIYIHNTSIFVYFIYLHNTDVIIHM